jgi:hypothetical protein
MDYKKAWNDMKEAIVRDLSALASPEFPMDSGAAFRIMGEKVTLNTMLKMENDPTYKGKEQ